MYKNILITGSSGFIGKHLVNKLEELEFNVLKFTRKNSEDDLAALVKKADFIFHLAGEVRPNSENKDFNKSNFELTQKLIDLIRLSNKHIPVLMTSTIHAINPKNAYGESKRQAEDALLNFAEVSGIDVYIYRLPHMFGEGCKPNYNSVISTWVFNSLHGVEINIYDRDIPMTYVYVQDFIDQAVKHLLGDGHSGILSVDQKYDVDLGYVYDLIKELSTGTVNGIEFNKKPEFAAKLLKVFESYKCSECQ